MIKDFYGMMDMLLDLIIDRKAGSGNETIYI